jgi:hypothetical protein
MKQKNPSTPTATVGRRGMVYETKHLIGISLYTIRWRFTQHCWMLIYCGIWHRMDWYSRRFWEACCHLLCGSDILYLVDKYQRFRGSFRVEEWRRVLWYIGINFEEEPATVILPFTAWECKSSMLCSVLTELWLFLLCLFVGCYKPHLATYQVSLVDIMKTDSNFAFLIKF